MKCGISGEDCDEPVYSKVSGVVYEKRTILKFIETEGKDPATGQDATVDDLLPVKVNKTIRPRPTTATSIPGLIALFQNEWDSLMVESYSLKDHLAKTRQELAQALYQHDAACRVIARLVKERDEALRTVSALQSAFAQRAVDQAAVAMDVEPAVNGRAPDINHPVGMPEGAVEAMAAKMETLSKGRKKRPAPEGLPPREALPQWTVKEDHALHQTDKPGVLSVDLYQPNQDLIVTGGVDKEAIVYDRKSEKVVSHLKGHSKKVNVVKFHPDPSHDGLVLTGSSDKSIKMWRKTGDAGAYQNVVTLTPHHGDVTGLSIQATGNYFASASRDKTWGFFDMATGQTMVIVSDPAVAGGFETLQFHPDGILLGTGTSENAVRMWDIKTQANVASFPNDHTAPVKSISFSENGYYMTTGSLDGTVRLWDLRKLKAVQTYDAGDPVNSVSFDFSGQYLAVGGKGVKVLAAKEMAVIAEYNAHSDKVTSVKWQYPASKFLVSASLDRTVKVYH